MSKNDNSRVAASEGSDLYSGADTYKTSDGTLARGIISIYIREDQAAMITSAKYLKDDQTEGTLTGNLIGANLLAGDFFTFKHELTEIVIAGGSFIGYQA